MKKTVFILLIFSFMMQIQAQAILRGSPAKLMNYYIDFLKLDSTVFLSIGIKGSDIKKVRTSKQGAGIIIIIHTKLLVVFNDELLTSKKEKKAILSNVNFKDIESIKKIDKSESIELYGKKGKNGALVIKIKDSG